jgi:hypothetical protein
MTGSLDGPERGIAAGPLGRSMMFLLVATLATAVAPVSADDCVSMRGARIYASAFAMQGFTVGLNDGERAPARLFTFDIAGREKTVWTAKLLNIPTDVYVADHGPMVVAVTSGACSAASEHAVVVYGSRGTVLGDYRLVELLSEQEITDHVTRTITGWEWGADAARFRFDRKANQIVLTLAWGREIRLDATTGRLATSSPIRNP